jgi:hypothetical protein
VEAETVAHLVSEIFQHRHDSVVVCSRSPTSVVVPATTAEWFVTLLQAKYALDEKIEVDGQGVLLAVSQIFVTAKSVHRPFLTFATNSNCLPMPLRPLSNDSYHRIPNP